MSEVRYTDQHEWIRLDGDEATVGITKYAAESLVSSQPVRVRLKEWDE